MSSLSISIIILNYASYKETEKLLFELQNQTILPQLKFIVVDNCSPNESYEYLKKLESTIENLVVLQTGANLGYAKGNNYGLKYVEDNNLSKYVAILNNDVILPNNCFERLINRYNELPNPCIIAPTQLSPNGEISMLGDLGSFKDDILLTSILCRRYRSRPVKKINAPKSEQRALKVEVINGSFMFASLERFKDIGYFYPNTFLYVEERFVAHAAKRMGYNNYVLLDDTYIHNHSTTINTKFDAYKKHQMWYKGILEYTRHCRSHGHIKALILMPFMAFSLLEWKIISIFHRILKQG